MLVLVLKCCACGVQVAVSCRPPGSTPKPTGRRQQGSARDTGSQTEMPPIDIDAVSNGDTVDGVVVRSGFHVLTQCHRSEIVSCHCLSLLESMT